MTITVDPGVSVAVDARIRGEVAKGEIDEAGAAGAYAHGTVHLECKSCDEAVG